jgi:hypothetical protein
VAETVNGRTLAFAYDALGRRTHRRTPPGAGSDLAHAWKQLATYTAAEHTFRFDRDALERETARTLDDMLTRRQAIAAKKARASMAKVMWRYQASYLRT